MAAEVCKSLLSCKSIADEWENCKCKGQKTNRINLKHQDGCRKHFPHSAHCAASMSQKMDTSCLSHSYKTSIYISYIRGDMGFSFLREKAQNWFITSHDGFFWLVSETKHFMRLYMYRSFFPSYFYLLSLEVSLHTLLVSAGRTVVLLDTETHSCSPETESGLLSSCPI